MDSIQHSQTAAVAVPTVYRWQYTMALSILHRVTGCALSVGLLLFVYWLVAAASGRDAYETARAVLRSIRLVRVLLIGFSFAFFYHLLNGVRHLTWDTGHGLERKSARSERLDRVPRRDRRDGAVLGASCASGGGAA